MTLNMNRMNTPKAKAPRIEEGTYMARVVSIVDLGIQPQTDWQTGEATDPKPRVLITWELPTERIVITEDGEEVDKPRWISKEYTLSNYEQSNLVKLVNILFGENGIDDLSDLVDFACMITIGSTSGGNAKVISVVRPLSGMEVAELENPSAYFDFDAPEQELFTSLIPWVREKIMSAENYNGFADEWTV